MLSFFSHVQLFVVHCYLPGSSVQWDSPREEYWSGLPFHPPGYLPNPGIEPASLKSPALAGKFFTASAMWDAHGMYDMRLINI